MVPWCIDFSPRSWFVSVIAFKLELSLPDVTSNRFWTAPSLASWVLIVFVAAVVNDLFSFGVSFLSNRSRLTCLHSSFHFALKILHVSCGNRNSLQYFWLICGASFTTAFSSMPIRFPTSSIFSTRAARVAVCVDDHCFIDIFGTRWDQCCWNRMAHFDVCD